VSKRAL